MFTEGLDENAINWIKQGSEAEEARLRSPLSPITDKLPLSPKDYTFSKSPIDPVPKSPLLFPPNSTFSVSSHFLPPLKFHSGLLTPRNIGVEDEEDGDGDDEVDESVASVPDGGACSEEELGPFEEVDYLERPGLKRHDEDVFGNNRSRVKLNRGLLQEDLRIEVPGGFRRFTHDGGVMESRRPALKTLTPGGASCSLRERVQHRNIARVAFDGALNNEAIAFKEAEDLATPSAPPIMETGGEVRNFEMDMDLGSEEDGKELHNSRDSGTCKGSKDSILNQDDQNAQGTEYVESEIRNATNETEEKMPYWHTSSLDQSSYYSTSGQCAWQTLVSYDACIRFCLYAWARGSTEAPEFLRDECLLLRSAFGLNKFLLQPRGVQPTEARSSKSADQMGHFKVKKVVGKIRVEARKLRVMPRRKLKSAYSRRSAMYLQMGKEYIQHVSSRVKTSMNSLKLPSFSVTSEEPLSCLFQLKSATDDTEAELGSNICLRPGTGDYHVFYPESEGDALLVEVQDTKESVQGRATIPISCLNDNPGDKVRWWPLYLEDQECVGKIQLCIVSTITCDETSNIKSGPVVETLAYDLLLEAAMRAQNFHSRNLRLNGPWKWLLTEFADYYGVSDSYTKLRYLSHVMSVATTTKVCLELVEELLVPVIKAKGEKILTRQERSLLLDCETRAESLLANVFENYKSLDEDSATGITEFFGPSPESASPALVPAIKVYILLHDILSQDAQNMLRNYFQTAAKKRCRKHMIETDEFVSSNSDGLLIDSITMATAYLKMKNLCINIGKEIKADIKIHNQNILPSCIDLSSIAAAVYSSELCNRVRIFLSSWPPSSPQPYVNELLSAVADFEQELELLNISPLQGGVDSKMLFNGYIMVWVQDMQLNLLEHCKAEKAPWTNHSTSPFAEEMYDKIKDSLIEYEVTINRWPQYSLILENAVADVERAILKALERQYNDVLTPLKDSIPKKLNMHVQKLTRRQSTALYSVPSQLGTFLNTIKRILDILHIRVEDILKSWASYLPASGDKKLLFGEQMNGITVLLRTKYKNYLQATIEKLVSNTQAHRSTRLKKILEEIKEEDGEVEVRERMQILSSHLIDSISNLHEVFTSRIFVAACRGFWDRMGQIVLKFLEDRKENRVWYNGSCYVLGILDDTFASQMQRLLGNSLQEKDLEPPRSVIEARSILCRDTTNATDGSSYFFV